MYPKNARVRPLSCPACAVLRCFSSLRSAPSRSSRAAVGTTRRASRTCSTGPSPVEIHSADLKLDAEVELKGLAQGPVKIEAERAVSHQRGQAALGRHRAARGLRRRRPDDHQRRADHRRPRLPEVPGRLLRAAAAAGPRSQPRDRARRKGAAARCAQLGLDPRTWLAEAKDEGDAEVAGVETSHVSGTLDVAQSDAQPQRVRAPVGARAGRGHRAAPRRPLSTADIRQHRRGRQGPELRRLRRQGGRHDPARLRAASSSTSPRTSRAALGRYRGRLDQVLGRVARRERRPGDRGAGRRRGRCRADRLARRQALLDGAGRHGRRAAGPGSPAPRGARPRRRRAGATPEPRTSSQYADCLDKARPEDTEALQRCADLLQQP